MTATAQPSARVAAQAAAAQPAPSRRPDARPRPPLRVVQPHERQPRRRNADAKKRTRLIAVSGILLGAVLLFGLVAAHVLLTQNQFRLQRVQRQAAEEQARYERLRAQVAELESPERVVAAAQERLGMVAPNSVKYLTPAGVVKSPPPPTDAGAGAAEEDEEQAVTDWSVVKRRLSSRP
jgi:cell division protein FtsL